MCRCFEMIVFDRVVRSGVMFIRLLFGMCVL